MKKRTTIILTLLALFSATSVFGQCNALFSYYSAGSGAFVFVDSSGGRYTSELWTFGDGTNSTSMGQVTHKYNATGTYTVCRIVTDSTRPCSDTFCTSVVYSGVTCKASFSYGVTGLKAGFKNLSTGGNNYYWAFGDGNTSTSANPTHTYTRNGTYQVCLTVYDSARTCTDTKCLVVQVGSSGTTCTADFDISINGYNVTFNAKQSGLRYQWTMANGNTFSTKTVKDTFVPSGSAQTFTACLIVSDSAGNCTDSTCKVFTIAKDTCDARFTAGSQGLTAYFRPNGNTVTGKTYLWDFGDGDTFSNYAPTHTYRTPGTYYVCLTVFDSKCRDTYCDSITVDTTTGSGNCKAAFGVQVKDSTATMYNYSTGATSYSWNFGDGSTSTAQSPTHTYSKPGTYTIWLIIQNGSSCVDSTYRTVTISKSSACRAYFRVAVDTSQKFKLFLLNGSSNKSTHTYYWTFGDGGTSTKRNPSHKYTKFGLYQICLTVSDSAGNCSSTYCDSIGLDSNGRMLKAEGFDVEVIEDLASITKPETLSLKAYPNPTTGIVEVQLEEYLDVNIEVYNIQGKHVLSKTAENSNRVSVDLSNYENGIYFLRIKSGDRVAQQRIIKAEN